VLWDANPVPDADTNGALTPRDTCIYKLLRARQQVLIASIWVLDTVEPKMPVSRSAGRRETRNRDFTHVLDR
jgi:hypothetical protein